MTDHPIDHAAAMKIMGLHNRGKLSLSTLQPILDAIWYEGHKMGWNDAIARYRSSASPSQALIPKS